MGTGFTDEREVGQAFTDHTSDADEEPSRIGVLALVESEGLFVKVSEQVERLDTDIGSTDGAFQKRPEILHAVGVYPVFHVTDSVIDGLMGKVRMKLLVRRKLVGIDRATRVQRVYELRQTACLCER